jgi:hypothetical protein
MSDFSIELYKSLRAEAASYHDKLQMLWLQKLTITGGLAAFLIVNFDSVRTVGLDVDLLIGVLILCILAVIIDLKVAEYAFHARAISQFIAREFSAEELPAKWETNLWGVLQSPERPMVIGRSLITVISAVAPTIALMTFAAYLVETRLGWNSAMITGLTIAFIYVSAVSVAAYWMFRSPVS